LSLEDIDEHFRKLDREYVPVYRVYHSPVEGRPCMAEVNIADLHFGKLSWHGDVGEDYDHRIAKNIVNKAVDRICEELAGKNVEQILFVWCNDYFNSDTIDNTTTAGTDQDVDCRWQKMFNAGVELLVSAIDRLSCIAPVKTFYTRSNHDQQTGYYATRFLDAWYRNDKTRVEVNNDASPRKYYAYGNTLLGFTHGDTEGKEKNTRHAGASRLASLMPLEARSLWGAAKYCEMHTAHLHSEHMIQECNGVIVRRIASPTATDTWHSESGYIGSTRKIQTFLYDKENGLEHIINTTV
jgi:hypothetical protein